MTIPPGLSDSLTLFGSDEAEPVALPGARLPSYIADHRARLRQRFLDGGAAALPDYELLELVLFRAIPRQDVKPLARRLLDTFGDVASVLSAPCPASFRSRGRVRRWRPSSRSWKRRRTGWRGPRCCGGTWCRAGPSSSTTAIRSCSFGSIQAASGRQIRQDFRRGSQSCR